MRFASSPLTGALLAAFAFEGARTAAYTTSTTDISVTLHNNQRILFDTNGTGTLDIAYARISYLGGVYRWIGRGLNCPLGTKCALKSYASVDLVNWNYEGQFADFCADLDCTRPHILYNKKNNNYVLWVNTAGGYNVYKGPQPLGPYTATGRASVQGFAGDLTIDYLDNDAYLAYSSFDFTAAGSIWPPFHQSQMLVKLNDDYTDIVGTPHAVKSAANDEADNNTEAPGLFQRNGWYYLAVSETCGNCNDAPLIIYRTKNLSSTAWQRQIISGDTCRGQTAGVLVLKPNSGPTTYLLNSDHWSGYGPPFIHGKGLQPLSFNSDGSIQDLNCQPNAQFTFKAPRGFGAANNGTSKTFSDSSEPNALYDFACDLNEFNIYQTWESSKSGNLKEVAINIGVYNYTSDFAASLWHVTSNKQFNTPSVRFDVITTKTVHDTDVAQGIGLLKFNPVNATVKAGDRLAVAIQGIPGSAANVGNYCYLYRNLSQPVTDSDSAARVFFYHYASDVAPRGKTATESPVRVNANRELSFYSIVD